MPAGAEVWDSGVDIAQEKTAARAQDYSRGRRRSVEGAPVSGGAEALSRVRLGGGFGLRVVLLDPQEPQQAVPVELGGDRYCSEPSSDDLEDHAPAAGIQVCENGGHRRCSNEVGDAGHGSRRCCRLVTGFMNVKVR